MKTINLLNYAKASNDNDIWADVLEAVEKIYDGPSAIIAKPTRFGFTTSMAKIAETRNNKLLIVKPTNKINETVKKAAPSTIPIFGHKYCQILAQISDKLLLDLPISLPSVCPRVGGCEEFPDCDLTKSWYESSSVRTLNYQKLVALMFGYNPSKISEISLLLEMLKDVEIVMFDESHEISLENSPSSDLNYSIKNIPIEFESLRKVYFNFCELVQELFEDDIISELDKTKNYLKSESFLSFRYENTRIADRSLQTQAFSELKCLAKQRTSLKFSDDDIKYLVDVISVMTCQRITANLITSSAGDNYLVTGKPTDYSPTIKNAIKLFLKEVCPNAKVFFVSGSQFEKYPGMFSEIVDRELANICVPDVKSNNSKLTIIPDTWEYGTAIIKGIDRSGKNDDRIKNQITDILIEHPAEPIYIICFNKKLQAKIINWKLPLPKGSLIDYYRSPSSIGVECSARIGIAIGIANNPTNTYDYATDNVAESRSLRFQSVHAATWQAWSRIKDPEGKIPSFLYCIGVRSDDVNSVIRQGSNRTVINNGKDNNNRNIPPTITLSEELPHPTVMMEMKTKIALEPRKCTVDDYIDCVVPLEDRLKDELVDLRLTKSLKTQLFYIYSYICEIVGKFKISEYKLYNQNESPDWIENNSILFYTNIISRIDKCGLQDRYKKPDKNWGYTTGIPKLPFDKLLLQHFNAKETIALPPFDTNDICYWCAADFDDHDGNNPQTDNVLKFTAYLRSLYIPYFVLLSGSNFGYHVWILLAPCKTYTAYKFIRQLFHDSGVKTLKDIEFYPKQKAASNSNNTKAYGNHLKLPNAYNWKAGRRSVLLDPITLEYTPFVTIPGVLRLHEINEVPVKHHNADKKPKTYIPVNNNFVNDGRTSGNIRPCLLNALNNQLTGGTGHMLRVAIAHDAINAGMDRESIIDIFSTQTDFIYEKLPNK